MSDQLDHMNQFLFELAQINRTISDHKAKFVSSEDQEDAISKCQAELENLDRRKRDEQKQLEEVDEAILN